MSSLSHERQTGTRVSSDSAEPSQGVSLRQVSEFEGTQLHPAQVILLLRGVCKGESSAMLSRELKLSRMTVHGLRQMLQANAQREQPQSPLKDRQTETDELFQNAGEKRRKTRRSG
jgi:hypothetical protein